MLTIVAISLLTGAIVSVIFLTAFIKLWKNPPTIEIKLPPFAPHIKVDLPKVEFGQLIPNAFAIKLQHEPAVLETKEPTEEPIPEEILDYISLESDGWAQEARKRRVRMLKRETGDWAVAFRLLQKEDMI